jgi:hypothetical protein
VAARVRWILIINYCECCFTLFAANDDYLLLFEHISSVLVF